MSGHYNLEGLLSVQQRLLEWLRGRRPQTTLGKSHRNTSCLPPEWRTRIAALQVLIQAGQLYQTGCQAQAAEKWDDARGCLVQAVMTLDDYFREDLSTGSELIPAVKAQLRTGIKDGRLSQQAETWQARVELLVGQPERGSLILPFQVQEILKLLFEVDQKAKEDAAQKKAEQKYEKAKELVSKFKQRPAILRILLGWQVPILWGVLHRALHSYAPARVAAPPDLLYWSSWARRFALTWSILAFTLLAGCFILLRGWDPRGIRSDSLPLTFTVTCVGDVTVSDSFPQGSTVVLSRGDQVTVEVKVGRIPPNELNAFWTLPEQGHIPSRFQFINPTSYTAPEINASEEAVIEDEIRVAVLYMPDQQRWDGELTVRVVSNGGMCPLTR